MGTPGAIRCTWPLVRAVLRQRKLSVLIVIAMVALLGVIPTALSGIESRMFRLVANAVDQRLSGEASQPPRELVGWPFSSELGLLVGVVASIAALAAVQAFFYFSAKAQSGLERDLFSRLRTDAMTRALFQTSSADVPDSDREGDSYASNIQGSCNMIADQWIGLFGAGQSVWTLIFATGAVALQSPVLAVAFLGVVLIPSIVTYLEVKRSERTLQEWEKKRDRLNAATADVIDNREVILAWEQGQSYSKKLEKSTQDYADTTKSIDNRRSFFAHLMSFTNSSMRLVVLLVGLATTYWIDPSRLATLGDAYFFVSLYSRLSDPTGSLLAYVGSIRRTSERTTEFRKLFRQPLTLDLREMSDSHPKVDTSVGIEVQNVTFAYPGKGACIKNCSFSVPPGQVTLLVGASGSGKSTLIRLLLGFLSPESGTINVGGRPTSGMPMAWSGSDLRLLLSYVPQFDHVLRDDVKANLFLKGGESDDQLLEALSAVGLNQTNILNLDARSLSGGERQRLAVARLMLDDSPVLLLDEPLANVDAATFATVLPHITKVLSDPTRTVLITSHRLAFAGLADRVVVLEDGKAAEEGSVQDLMSTNSNFQRMLQAAQKELAYSSSSPPTITAEQSLAE